MHISSCALSVWDLSTTPPEILYTADVDWPVRALAFHLQGDILAVAEGYDGNISVMDWRLGKQLTKFDGTGEKPAKITFSPDGDDLAVVYNVTNTPVVVWNLESEETTAIVCPGSDDGKASDIAFHPHQHLLAVACGDRIIF